MTTACCHEYYLPETRIDPAEGWCKLERDEYEDDCEGCPEKYGRRDYEDDMGDLAAHERED